MIDQLCRNLPVPVHFIFSLLSTRDFFSFVGFQGSKKNVAAVLDCEN